MQAFMFLLTLCKLVHWQVELGAAHAGTVLKLLQQKCCAALSA
jgi:hypothetical protein